MDLGFRGLKGVWKALGLIVSGLVCLHKGRLMSIGPNRGAPGL